MFFSEYILLYLLLNIRYFGKCESNCVNPFVTSPGDLRVLGRLFRYEAQRSPGLIA